ncbi:MAG TPA: hypothetical protein VFZ61_20320 [Polyangiales bacterium]
MQKTIESALAAVALTLVLAMTESGQTHAQDQEEGALELESAGRGEDSAKAAAAEPPAPVERELPRDEPEEPSRSAVAPGPWRAYAGVRLGMGGSMLFKDADLAYITRFTPGFALGGDYVLHRLFAIGLETRFDFASIEADGVKASFMFWSLAAKPRVRHQLKQLPLEIYAAVPAGLSISNAKEDFRTGKASGMVGLAAGANYFFTSHWALTAELGWTWQFLRFEAPQNVPGLPTVALFEARFGQMALALNALYAF